jgi:hypothetical protein
VSIPDVSQSGTPEHDQAQAPATCPACRDNVRMFYAGEITGGELQLMHRGYSLDDIRNDDPDDDDGVQ